MASALPDIGDIRFARPGDRDALFVAAGRLRGRLTIGQAVDHHDPSQGRWTLFRIWADQIAGAILLVRRAPSLHVEFLARNQALEFPEGFRVGSALLAAVEELAVAHAAEMITLDCVDDPKSFEFYSGRGFAVLGPAWPEEGWGLLRPMGKRVRPKP